MFTTKSTKNTKAQITPKGSDNIAQGRAAHPGIQGREYSTLKGLYKASGCISVFIVKPFAGRTDSWRATQGALRDLGLWDVTPSG